jgi:hypothetical protein
MPFLGIRNWDFRCRVLERKPANHTLEALAERYLNNNRLMKEFIIKTPYIRIAMSQIY